MAYNEQNDRMDYAVGDLNPSNKRMGERETS